MQGEDVDADEDIKELLHEVGGRELPAPELMAQVRDAVHGEWRQMVEQRTRRRRFVGFAMAASVAGVALAVTFVAMMFPRSVVMAQVARVSGSLQIAPANNGAWREVLPGEELKTGDTIRTGEGSSAALDLGEGISVRIAARSLIELAAVDRIALDHGGVYVDSDPQQDGEHTLVLQTPYGSVRHLGTQYQVHTERNSITVAVREGRVEIANPAGTQTAVAGEQVGVASHGLISRTAISSHDERWQWAARVAPPMNIEHQPLSAFVDWVGRETGRQVVYASSEAQSQAGQLILRGSVGELNPEQALDAVLAPTAFTHRETAETIEIARQAQ